MSDPQELRKRAEQARRAALVRTVGGQAADRQLLTLAIKLEEKAAEIDRATLPRD
jgi:hypothetical protein